MGADSEMTLPRVERIGVEISIAVVGTNNPLTLLIAPVQTGVQSEPFDQVLRQHNHFHGLVLPLLGPG